VTVVAIELEGPPESGEVVRLIAGGEELDQVPQSRFVSCFTEILGIDERLLFGP